MPEFRDEVEQNGFAVLPSGVPEVELDALALALEGLADRVSLGARGGVRDAFRLLPAVRDVALSPPLWQLATSVLGSGCAAVRAIIFDKSPGANWKVGWHQDLTIAVRTRVAAPGLGPWSVKAGIVHVQPPARCSKGCSLCASIWTSAERPMDPSECCPARTELADSPQQRSFGIEPTGRSTNA